MLATKSYDPDAAETPPPEFFFTDVISFYTDHLAPMIRRRDGGGRSWCPQWWRHPEAVARLTALHHAWEALRLEPGTGMSTWWTYHFEPCYAVLSDAERGPFQACGRKTHSDRLGPLPHDPLPPEWISAWAGSPERSPHA